MPSKLNKATSRSDASFPELLDLSFATQRRERSAEMLMKDLVLGSGLIFLKIMRRDCEKYFF